MGRHTVTVRGRNEASTRSVFVVAETPSKVPATTLATTTISTTTLPEEKFPLSSRSGESFLLRGVLTLRGRKAEIFQRLVSPDLLESTFSRLESDPLSFLPPARRAAIERATARYLVVPRGESTAEVAKTWNSIAKFTRDVRVVPAVTRVLFSVGALTDSQLVALRRDSSVAVVLTDHRLFLLGVSPLQSLQRLWDRVRGIFPSTETLARAEAENPPVIVGVVDTGVDRMRGDSYITGPDLSRFFAFFQPWQRFHSFRVRVPQTDWLNVTVAWPAGSGTLPSPADLDLVLRDSSGRIVAQSAAAGSLPQSERIELRAPPAGDYTVEIIVKGNPPTVIPDFDDAGGVMFLNPAVTLTAVEAGRFPQRIDIVFDRETNTQPRGALPSRTNTWKI